MALLERAEETAAISAALQAAVEGHGQLLLIEGEAGAGKSSLLGFAADAARDREMLVLGARGGEHERDFPYGVIRQLFEPQLAGDDSGLLSGAAALAAPVFDVVAQRGPTDRVAIQHGLYWLGADLSARSPLALVVDDVQWADVASLHALVYLARRLEGLPIALVAAIRTGEPSSPDELLATLRQEPAARVVVPAPLSPDAVTELGRHELGPEASDGFLGACQRASGGNPLLVVELFRALAAEKVLPTDASADQVAKLASAGVARSVVLRLDRLGVDAAEVARTVAVLEPNAAPEHVAALSGYSSAETATLCDRLIGVHLLTDVEPVGFVHPLVREAVYKDTSAPRRAALHFEAARRLSASGAAVDSVAAHLMRSPPSEQDWVVVSLRSAAQEALARSASEAATEYLQRALSEPPRAADLLDVRQELGAALLEGASERGVAELLAVRAQSDDPVRRASGVPLVGTLLALRGRAADALALIAESIAELEDDDPELRAHLVGARYVASMLGGVPVRPEGVMRDIDDVSGTTFGERQLLDSAALLLAAGLGPPRDAASVAERVIADRDAIIEDVLGGRIRANCMFALAVDDQTELALDVIDGQIKAARRRGWSISVSNGTSMRALILLFRGELVEAEAEAALALGLVTQTGMARSWPMAAAALAAIRVERGELDLAEEVVSAQDLSGELGPGLPAAMLLCSRGGLRSAQGRHEEAREDFLAAGERVEWLPNADPEILGWRSGVALAEFALGRPKEARKLAAEAVGVARGAKSARGIGVTLRIQGVVSGSVGVEALREAAETLSATTARLQHAHALVELGAALRRANRRRESRVPLREGLDLAHRCGAQPLEERARVELSATGARPRKAMLSGVESLTASELRVAQLAAEGLTNREIAQSLFVTAKTVEFHLRHCYQKLEIERRSELASVLG